MNQSIVPSVIPEDREPKGPHEDIDWTEYDEEE